MNELATQNFVLKRIRTIRNTKVILDSDLAKFYQVETRVLLTAVKRNLDLFPDDFMFQLTKDESEEVFATHVQGGRRYLPYVFTEQGVAMLSGVLKSKRAREVNIYIMRAFVEMRSLVVANEELSLRLHELEKKYDYQFQVVFDAIRDLITPVHKVKKRRIGLKD